MRTVYGIYEKGADVPLYVGCTVRDLNLRLRQHVSSGALQHRSGKGRKKTEAILKNLWMFNASRGLVHLEIRSLAEINDRGTALSRERQEILHHKPILNSQISSKRPTPP